MGEKQLLLELSAQWPTLGSTRHLQINFFFFFWESGGWEIKSNKEMYEAVWERGPGSLALK